MAGKIVFVPEVPHRCEIEFLASEQEPGTIWQCDDCDKKFVVVSGQGEDMRGYYAWRELTLTTEPFEEGTFI